MLLDEPAAGLDLGGREDLVRRLGELAADVEAPALVLVTHHVEEIPPSFTDVLLLREGRIVAQGPIEITLTEDNLSKTFGMPLELEQRGERWAARARFGGGTTQGPSTSLQLPDEAG
jgi:iron complex transport system ATP-binding protein